MSPILKQQWQTKRLAIRDSVAADAPAMRDIFNACARVVRFDPTFYEIEEDEVARLIDRATAVQPSNKIFRIQSVWHKEDLIGYCHLAEGEPLPDLVWISMLVLHPSVQGQHLGQEMVNGLVEQYTAAGKHRAIWLEVYTKNWTAMSFWIRQGFTRIIEYGAGPPGSPASLVLERPL